MGYYGNNRDYIEYKKFVKNKKNNYKPPRTFKNRKPTKEEFNIQNLDIDQLEKDRKDFYERQKKYDLLPLLSFWFGIFPAMIMAYLIILLFNISDDYIGYIAIPFWILLMIVCFRKSSDNTYSREDEYKRLKDYYEATSQYEWWQDRKKKNFWYSLNGREFEIEISNIFLKLGYETTICKQGGDEGIDIKIKKDGIWEIIQCKAHKSKISPTVARDLLGTMINSNVSHAYLITLNGGTSGTIDFCRKNNITLWDVDDIIKHHEM